MTFHALVPLVPLVFAVHNAEEASRMAAWSATLPSRLHRRVSTPQFTVAVVLLTLVVAAAAAWAYLDPERPAAIRTLLAFQAAIGFNALLPHLGLLMRQRRYNPGVVTAVLLNVPFSVWLFRTALAEGRIGWRGVGTLVLLAPLLMVGTALGALWVGGRLTKPPAPPHLERGAGAA